jgi:hypothetical protein
LLRKEIRYFDLTVTPAVILVRERIDAGGNADVANEKVVRALNKV